MVSLPGLECSTDLLRHCLLSLTNSEMDVCIHMSRQSLYFTKYFLINAYLRLGHENRTIVSIYKYRHASQNLLMRGCNALAGWSYTRALVVTPRLKVVMIALTSYIVNYFLDGQYFYTYHNSGFQIIGGHYMKPTLNDPNSNSEYFHHNSEHMKTLYLRICHEN